MNMTHGICANICNLNCAVYRCSNDDKLDVTDHFYIIECGLHWRLDVIMNDLLHV